METFYSIGIVVTYMAIVSGILYLLELIVRAAMWLFDIEA